jgi:hypothetical protein
MGQIPDNEGYWQDLDDARDNYDDPYSSIAKSRSPKINKHTVPRGKMVTVECKACRDPFEAREADVKRGWGKFCSKSCKASYQKNGKSCYGKIVAHKYFLDNPYNKNKYKKILAENE